MNRPRTQRGAPPGDSSTEHVVDVTGMVCRYGDFTAVRGIDMTVGRGELYGLLGTNGAGKTTSIDTMEGHRKPHDGRVRVLGLDPHRHRRRLAGRVSAISQESGFAAELTVDETLRMWRRLHPGRSGPADPLSRVELTHRRDVRVHQLSGGERRRLDLAMAISTGPELLFLDEPTTGMDPASRERTWDVLRGLRDGGCAIILTTHYLEEAEALSDHLAIMDRGRVALRGTVAEVVATHAARISCRIPEGAACEELPRLSGVTTLDDGALTVRTSRLQADLHALLDWARRSSVELNQLNATEASLHEVFTDIQRRAEHETASKE